MKKGKEDRSTGKRKPICPKCANVQCVFAVFVKIGDLFSPKSCKNHCKTQRIRASAVGARSKM